MATLFLLDDSPTFIPIVSRVLERRGHRVVDYTNPFDLLNALKCTVPDVLLIGTYPGGISGLELVRALRGHARFTVLPIALLSRLTDPAQWHFSREGGADVLLCRTGRPEVVVAALLKLLQHPRACQHRAPDPGYASTIEYLSSLEQQMVRHLTRDTAVE